MTTINAYYTFAYSQPKEYRFSHDSVFLARQAFEYVKEQNLANMRGLDICAGSGVIGLDFLFHCENEIKQNLKSFSFLEIQEVYHPHFLKNVAESKVQTPCHWLQQSYDVLQTEAHQERYDLILCNPPYFRIGQGKMSPSEFKNRCRFFVDSNFDNLMKGIENALAPNGVAFLLLRDLQDHNWNPFAELKDLIPNCTFEKLEPIRGTDCILIRKKEKAL